MASAYELMLVLRGRNYLSNDLRRAGADISRLKSGSQLTAARQQLQINQQRLASTRAIAQQELKSVTVGARRVALNKAIAAQTLAQETAVTRVRRAEEALEATQRQQLVNQANLSRLTRRVTSGRPMRGFNMTETQALFEAAQVEHQRLASVQATNRRALEENQRALANMSIATQGLTEREAALIARQAQLTDVINTTTAAQELNTIKLNENAMAIARQPYEKFAAGARYVEHLGRAFQTLGLVATVALGIAAHSAAAFQTQITLASTQATLVGDRSTAKVMANTRRLQADVQKMLISGSAAKPSDLTGGLYTIFSGLTLPGNQKQQLREGIGILKEFNTVFTANFGQVEFNDVTKAGIALINNFGLSAKQIPVVMNQMQASVRFGAMTMGEMTASLNQVIPAFKTAGYSSKQMFADIAFVSRLFPSLRVGTTGLARLTETFAKFHEKISEDVGTNIAPGGHLSPIATIVAEIIKAHPTFVKGGVDLANYFKEVTGSTSTIQARRVFVDYATRLGLYKKVASDVVNDNHELTKSFRDMSQTPQVRWAEFTNQLRGLSMEIGASVIPVFQKLAKPVQDVIKWFDKLDPSTKKTIGTIAAWASVGMLFGGTALIVVGALGRMYAAMRLLLIGRAGIAALEDGFITTGAALRVGLIGALILAIPLLMHYHTQIGHVIDALGGLKHVLTMISIIMVAFKFRGFITGLLGIQTAAAAAELEVAALGASLAAIATLGIIGVTIVVTYEAILHRKQISNAISKATDWALGKVGVDLPKVPDNITHSVPIYDEHHHLVNVKNYTDAQWKKLHETPNASVEAAMKARAGVARSANRDVIAAAAKAQAAGVTSSPGFDVNAAIANVEKLRRIAEKTPSLANFTAYEKARSALESHFKGDALTALNDYLSKIESAENKSNRKRTSAAKKAAAERLQALKEAAANTLSMYDTLLQQNQTIMGQLFEGPFVNKPTTQNRLQFGGKLNASDYLKDLRSQTKQFTTFYTQIGKLQRRGAPQELINQLIQAGPQALPAIKALANMGDGQWGQYIKVFKHGQNLLHKQTMIQLTAQLKDYRKYGEKIALQIISGMRDKRLGLTNEIKNIIKQIFGVDVPSVHKPSKTPKHTRTTQTATEHHTHYHVTAPKSEHASVRTQLRHAGFAAKAKYERTR